jgi:hypothetical protein
VELSVSRDGNIHFGDVVMIVNPQTSDCQRCTHALCFTLSEGAIYHAKDNICADSLDVVASSLTLTSTGRSAFVIRRFSFCL